jgi:hypothetical protein
LRSSSLILSSSSFSLPVAPLLRAASAAGRIRDRKHNWDSWKWTLLEDWWIRRRDRWGEVCLNDAMATALGGHKFRRLVGIKGWYSQYCQ